MDGDTEFSRVAGWYLRREHAGGLYHVGEIVAIAELRDCLTVVSNTWDKYGRHVIAAELSDGTIIDGDELTLGMWPIGMYAYRFGSIERIQPVRAENRNGAYIWEWEGR